MKGHRLWMFGLLFIFTCVLSGDAEEPPEVPLPTEEEQLERAEWMIPQYYDKVGKRLTATLANERLPIRQRVQAAKRLGIMKYPPAIPTLLQNIQLIDPDIQVISGNEDEPLIVVNALAQYGNAALPRLIDAYLDEPAKLRRHFFLYAILGGKTQKAATTYLAGLRAQKDHRVSASRLQEWRNYIEIE